MNKLVLTAFFGLMAIASCKKDSKEDGAGPGLIVGKWELVSQTITVSGVEHTVNVPADARPSYWTFTSDGRLQVDGNYDFDHDKHDDTKAEGSYSLSGTRLTLSGGGEPETIEVKELTDVRLTVVYVQDAGGSLGISFKKVR